MIASTQVLGVSVSTVLKQILLWRGDLEESGGPLTGTSRSAFVETFTREDVSTLQGEASYLSHALDVDLLTKAGLPRARSALASCAVLLSSVQRVR